MNKKIALSQLFSSIDAQLKTIYADPILCRQYSWWLLEAVTQIKKPQLLTQEIISLTPKQQKALVESVDKLVHEQMPLQYVLGSVPFNDLEIFVEPPILIPRPETEEWCINLMHQLQKLRNKKIIILDLCSGSGCIAIALAKRFTQATVIGADINPRAVMLGKKNAQHNKVRNVEFLQSDLFSSFDTLPYSLKLGRTLQDNSGPNRSLRDWDKLLKGKRQQFDLIVANPPYIAPKDWKSLEPSVKNWEDKKALIAADNGLAIIKKIIDQSYAYLKDNIEFLKKQIPQLVLEIDYYQAHSVTEYMKQAGFENIQVHKDLEKKDRVVSGSKSYVAPAKII